MATSETVMGMGGLPLPSTLSRLRLRDYAFMYVNKKRSKKFLVKCLAMDDYLLVDALAVGGDDVPHIEIKTKTCFFQMKSLDITLIRYSLRFTHQDPDAAGYFRPFGDQPGFIAPQQS
ncbi:unnamed protein product [Arabidopsis lyrata]|nr:unnamed protein product [Arabidopsis lyrata]